MDGKEREKPNDGGARDGEPQESVECDDPPLSVHDCSDPKIEEPGSGCHSNYDGPCDCMVDHLTVFDIGHFIKIINELLSYWNTYPGPTLESECQCDEDHRRDSGYNS